MRFSASLLAAAASLAWVAIASATEPHELLVTLKPVVTDGAVFGIDVSETLNDPPALDGKPFSLIAPVPYALVPNVADRVVDLAVRDANGPLEFQVEDDQATPGGYPYYRHWHAARDVHFPVTISYRALVQPSNKGPNGPPFGIRPSGGGISGAGGGFLLLPENGDTTQSQVRWDLSELPQGSVGVSSFGNGPFTLPGGPEQLNEGWFMAGPAQVFKAARTPGFSAYILGQPNFDVPTEMEWAANAYAFLGKAYGYLRPVPEYRVFMRVLDTPPFGSGTALKHSFMLSMGQGTPAWSDGKRNRETLFHEMAHQWTGLIEGESGPSAWFIEGLNTYFTTVLMMRGDLIDVDQYIEIVNKLADGYYMNPARAWSVQEITKVGFTDDAIRSVSYWRGALYFADLEAKLLRKSHGKRTLMDFLRPLFELRQKGVPLTVAAWEVAIAKEFGPSAVQEFRTTQLEGTQTIVPADGAFGPCVSRITVAPVDGKPGGYRWVRAQGVPDSKCTRW